MSEFDLFPFASACVGGVCVCIPIDDLFDLLFNLIYASRPAPISGYAHIHFWLAGQSPYKANQ